MSLQSTRALNALEALKERLESEAFRGETAIGRPIALAFYAWGAEAPVEALKCVSFMADEALGDSAPLVELCVAMAYFGASKKLKLKSPWVFGCAKEMEYDDEGGEEYSTRATLTFIESVASDEIEGFGRLSEGALNALRSHTDYLLDDWVDETSGLEEGCEFDEIRGELFSDRLHERVVETEGLYNMECDDLNCDRMISAVSPWVVSSVLEKELKTPSASKSKSAPRI